MGAIQPHATHYTSNDISLYCMKTGQLWKMTDENNNVPKIAEKNRSKVKGMPTPSTDFACHENLHYVPEMMDKENTGNGAPENAGDSRSDSSGDSGLYRNYGQIMAKM